jgi:hypothetical protein
MIELDWQGQEERQAEGRHWGSTAPSPRSNFTVGVVFSPSDSD